MSERSLAILEPTGTKHDCTAVVAKPIRRPRTDPRIWRWFVALNVVGVILAGVLLRCRGLGNLPGINGDEAWYGVQAELLLQGQPIAWRTPSGNLINPLFFVPQLAMHAIFRPSFIVLRATAVASGLAALVLNFWLCRRVLGRETAIISTTVLAALPIDIAYSRLAWDASQSLLATLPCVYLPLWAVVEEKLKLRLSVATIAALVAAIVVHPTNLFVAPITIACLAYAWRKPLLSACNRTVGGRTHHRKRNLLIASVAAIVAFSALAAGLGPRARSAWLQPAVSRIVNPPQYAEFVVNFGRFFTGATVFEYLSGAIQPAAAVSRDTDSIRWEYVPYDLAAWIIGGLLVWGLARAVRWQRPELICLCFGFGASLFGFFLVAGPGATAPNFERYAIWMIAPAAVLASISIGSWQGRTGRTGRLATATALALGWLLVLGFQINCLGYLRQTGGRSHRAFRTAALEPKQAALTEILAQCGPRETVRIVTSEWWTYWPMRYLAVSPASGGEQSISVELCSSRDELVLLPVCQTVGRGRLWFVEFTGSAACDALRRAAGNDRAPLQETTVDDFAGRPILSLFTIRQGKN